ncbi:hypothetical protein BDW22DRAFT_136505 [Trametopsis cervina]|nr:hypothetical protein BDW22DRAFT_136505 [Trametopsis cervina]
MLRALQPVCRGYYATLRPGDLRSSTSNAPARHCSRRSTSPLYSILPPAQPRIVDRTTLQNSAQPSDPHRRWRFEETLYLTQPSSTTACMVQTKPLYQTLVFLASRVLYCVLTYWTFLFLLFFCPFLFLVDTCSNPRLVLYYSRVRVYVRVVWTVLFV